MKAKLILPIICLLYFWNYGSASDLNITNIRSVNRGDMGTMPISVIFDISWENSWNNEKNHDAAWVFLKFNGYGNNHVKLSSSGHRILKNRSQGNAKAKIEISEDGLGFYVYPSTSFRGKMDLKLQIAIDTSTQRINGNRLNGLKVHGIEMVYIPEGAFQVGSPDKPGIKRAAFYQSDANGQVKGTYSISSEAAINVAPEDNSFYYWSETALYNGDQKGPIPAAFPKGYAAFYIMKYELTQGHYAVFLNSLPDNWTYTRSPIGGRNYHKKRGGIRFENGHYTTDNPSRPMNYVSFTDGLAFTDWACLRPITELEYEKAARGPGEAIPFEFVWGTNNYDQLERYISPEADAIFANGHKEEQLNDTNRAIFGASYYWVMDLSGSVWEKVITVGNPIGRAFEGTHGDGRLSFGHATNEDWPKSDDEIGGFGYRGGGYYEIGRGYSDFNPHSPIGYRYYGAWSGGPRYIAYGYRAGRTAGQ